MNSSDIWYGTLKTVLKIPGAKVDRRIFLTKVLSKQCDEEQVIKAIETSPRKADIERSIISKIAKKCVNEHKLKSTFLSTISGMPGGMIGIGSIPADLIQFYWHIIVISQELAYLYGWPDLLEGKDEIDDTVLQKLTVFIGVMLGIDSAKKGLGTFIGVTSKQGLASARKFLNSSIVKIIEEIAKRLGYNLGTKRITRILGIMIPIVGGGICGLTTFITIGHMGENLRAHLQDLPFANE